MATCITTYTNTPSTASSYNFSASAFLSSAVAAMISPSSSLTLLLLKYLIDYYFAIVTTFTSNFSITVSAAVLLQLISLHPGFLGISYILHEGFF